MKKKKERKEKRKNKRKVRNMDFTRVVPENPPEGVFINNTGWFYEDKSS